MKNKINNKQRIMMKLAGTFLFLTALILILNLVFNGDKVDKKYLGTWKIGYEFKNEQTSDGKNRVYTQELYLLENGTFYTKSFDNNEEQPSYNGNYEINDDELKLEYLLENENQINNFYFQDDKLCLSKSCTNYYTKDEIKGYFVINGES